MVEHWRMSSKYYLLLREKFKLEKKRDEVLINSFNLFLIEKCLGGSERKRLLEEYKSIIEDLKVTQQKLEPEFEVE